MESECQGSSTPMVKKVEMQAACHGDEDKGKEGATAYNMGCISPVIFFEEFNLENLREWDLRCVSIAKAIPNDVIVRDPIPQWVRDAFYKIAPRLEPILEKDGVRCFLRFFESEAGMNWDLTITSQTLTHMVIHNAMRCAKVVLEGKEQELNGMHANPNCINPYGYFPLHEAAEKFSIDMIKLLFRHGACANVRTVGDEVIENLLPLHVAVENACLHKYLEDNLSPTQDYQDYIYKLICLLCLPEMKIFLDTIRLLAEKTDNLVDEVWNYIKEEKLVQTTVLLLAAQGQIRGGRSSKRNGNGRQDGFHIIMDRIVKESLSLRSKRGESGNALDQLEERIKFNDSAYQLLSIIFLAGEELNVYIQEHSEVPHVEVLQRVSSILKDTGFCPTGEGIEVSNLRPYDCKMSDRELCNKDAAKAATATAHAAGKRVMRKKLTGGWDPEYTRRMFFPYWRSVLAARCRVKVYPSYAPADAMSALDLKELRDSWSDSTSNGSLRSPKHDLSLLGRIWQPTSNHQSRRLYSTTAFTLLKKVLRK